MRTAAAYVAAVLAGLAMPALVLWLARTSAAGTSPWLAAAAVVAVLGLASALVAAAAPRHWLWLALIASLPLGLYAGVMFYALADIGEIYWVWLGVALGGIAAALAGAFAARRLRGA